MPSVLWSPQGFTQHHADIYRAQRCSRVTMQKKRMRRNIKRLQFHQGSHFKVTNVQWSVGSVVVSGSPLTRWHCLYHVSYLLIFSLCFHEGSRLCRLGQSMPGCSEVWFRKLLCANPLSTRPTHTLMKRLVWGLTPFHVQLVKNGLTRFSLGKKYSVWTGDFCFLVLLIIQIIIIYF